MKIEEKFNKRSADLIEVQPPSTHVGQHQSELGIKLTFCELPGNDRRSISMHMTPDQALALAASLIEAARRAK